MTRAPQSVLLCVVLLGIVGVLSNSSPSACAAEPPNIVLIMADDIGYECFGCYGSGQYRTPNIDRLARGGVRFTHCYSQPLCTPSRVKLMTGLSNARNYSAFSILNRDQRTFGHYLKEAGYRTAVAGKWQLFGAEHYPPRFRGKGTLPRDAGFEHFCLWQVDRLGGRYWKPLLNVDGRTRQFSEKHFGPEIATDFLLEFMAENRERPFFAYYPMILVHSPFVPTPDSENRDNKNRQQNFEDQVAYMDKLVGQVVRKTEQLGIAERTLILFTGDNGTHRSITSKLNGRKIRGGKGQTTDAGTRVPLVAYWPRTIPPGRVCEDLVDFSDFLPTLLDVAGCEPVCSERGRTRKPQQNTVTRSEQTTFQVAGRPIPDSLDGRSFLPQLKGKRGNPREWIYVFSCPRPERHKSVRFVRDRRWKLYGDGRFFDILHDPDENKPLADLKVGSPAAAARKKLAAALSQSPRQGQTLLEFSP